MVEILYNFIRNSLIGETTISGADNLATLLTWTCIVMIFLLFVRLVFWAFNVAFKWRRKRY